MGQGRVAQCAWGGSQDKPESCLQLADAQLNRTSHSTPLPSSGSCQPPSMASTSARSTNPAPAARTASLSPASQRVSRTMHFQTALPVPAAYIHG